MDAYQDFGGNVLECDSLTKIYASGNKKKALDSLSFQIPSKGIFVLIGRNGSGKTTLVRILATELEPTSGCARINGMDVMKQARDLRERIAIVPQEARAVPWMTPLQTVHSYLLWRGFGYREAKRRALETLESVGLGEQSNALNRSLSGGTRRKVMVATVLASEAEIIFLDEPTTGLDPISRRDFWALLQKVGKERFTFLTTHYLEEAEYLAGKIGILDEGHIVSIGALEELRQKIRYNYVLTPLLGSSGFDIRSLVKKGELITGSEGNVRVLTTEEEAFDILRDLARLGLRFTINPLSLDDIFFYLVRKESAS